MDLTQSDQLELSAMPMIQEVDSTVQIPMEWEVNGSTSIIDHYHSQVGEWIKIQHPERSFTNEELKDRTKEFLSHPDSPFGNWVFYPWLNSIVRILNEEMFYEVRTSRNHYKITPHEQRILKSKCIGIVGLSVGQSAAITLAMEHVGGTLRLADFDTLDLSNLNRLRAGLHQLGLPKTVIAAREIAQINPYLKVELFHEGVTPENALSFLQDLDLLVEECDALPVKIQLRELAKTLRLPVIMDTSDRGMVDIERFDSEPERPIFHGKLSAFEGMDLKDLTKEDKSRLLFSLVDYPSASERARKSYAEIGKTITTWPQLASAVALGGAMMTDSARRILLNQPLKSGRYYVDLEELIGKDD